VRELDRDGGRASRARRGDDGGPYDAITVRAVAAAAWAGPARRLLGRDGVLVSWIAPGSGAAVDGFAPVITSRLPAPERGGIVAWRDVSRETSRKT